MQTIEEVLGSRVNVAVLRYLAAIRGSLSGNEVAKRLQLQQSSVRQALERLVEAGVVTRTDIGRSAAYELDQRLAFVRALLIPLFREEARLRDRLMGALARGSGKLKPTPRAVILFGSLARGTRDFRDVDLLCIVAKERDKSLLHDAIADRFDQIRREYKVPVSALVVREAELRSPKLESAVMEVRRDGVLLFGTAPGELRGLRALSADARTTK
jgi:DNA-binding transcriptional ArsR family regulator/predicted nucleotidyltransferase